VGAQVDPGHGDPGDPPGGILTQRREDAPVVVDVDVHVEEVIGTGVAQGVEHVGVATLAHVHDALEHACCLLTRDRRPEPADGTLADVNLGAPELIIVLLIILLIFGGSKLPQLARSLGKAQSEFKKGSEEDAVTTDRSDPPPPV
jgi:TatA/E family protein of Tat protein translocase